MIRDIVYVERDGRALLDRQSLSALLKRSVHTIRARCPIVGHERGKALYDMEECIKILASVPPRPHARVLEVG